MRVISIILLFLSSVAVLATEKPNIILILADDLGYAELGCYGQTKIRTLRIDGLAAEGMRFTQNYSGNAVCAPSRCVLMTGKHPGHAYVRNNSEVRPEGQRPIPDSEVTVAEALRAHGYATGAFGKWGLGFPGSEGDPLNQGFDRFFGYNCQRHAHSYYPSYLWSDRERIELKNEPPIPGHASFPKDADPSKAKSYDRFKGQDYAPDRINEQALRFIRDHQEQPFFLYYPTVIPHVALHVPDEDLKPYLNLGWNDPPFTRAVGYGYTPHFKPRAAYAAMITRLDTYVGRILDLLEELDLAENTIVVFTSDNGTTHLKAEVDYDFFQSVGPLRGLKGSLYEGGVRVPLIVRWPGRIRAGSVSDYQTGFEDWLPTLLDIVGPRTAGPEETDGVSIAPVLLGEYQREREFLYREFPAYGGQQAVWLGPWKGVRQHMLVRGTPNPLAIELYHLGQDVSESTNVAAEHPKIVAQIEALMIEQRRPSEVFAFPGLD
ncbi:MAG: Arylsulfatase [Verrucomicrobia subdivision 3 bacterium]|nr:Arylsulfatase [Limisphaerales bacterium]MCS1415932.1 Arylsulfatase [Limisphaerales bacterium]